MKCAVLFSRGAGWDNAAVAAAGHDVWTHCAPLVEIDDGAVVIDASHGQPVRRITYREWMAAHPGSVRVDLPGIAVTDTVRQWLDDLPGRNYDWMPVRWHIWKPIIWMLHRVGLYREDPEAYACTEATIRVFHSEGFMNHLPPSSWFSVHPDTVYAAALERAAGFRYGRIEQGF